MNLKNQKKSFGQLFAKGGGGRGHKFDLELGLGLQVLNASFSEKKPYEIKVARLRVTVNKLK